MQIPAVVSPTRSRKRQHELRAPINFPPSVGRLCQKRMSLLFLSCLSIYRWYNHSSLLSLPSTSESLSVFTPSCSFCTTPYDIQAVSIFQCIQFQSEIRRGLLDIGFFFPFFFSGDFIGLKRQYSKLCLCNKMYAVLPPRHNLCIGKGLYAVNIR